MLWLVRDMIGGTIVGGVLSLLPAFLLLSLLAGLYLTHDELGWVRRILHGVKPAAVAIVLFAAWHIGSRALKNEVP